MIDHALNMESYYFSTTYDVTHTFQRLHNTSPDFAQMPLHERVSEWVILYFTTPEIQITHIVVQVVTIFKFCIQADPRFVWNGHLLKELTQQPDLARYCLPVMLGCILSINFITIRLRLTFTEH